MRIDFLVQKAVVHNFLRIPQSTFPLLHSRVQMESSRSSTQTMTTTSSNIIKTFAWIPFVEASEMRIDFLLQKAVVHNFLWIPQSTFPLLHSRVQMESRRSCTQTKSTTSFNIVKFSFKYHLYKPQKWRLISWCKRLLFTIFSEFREVRFHCYTPEFKWNQAVLLLKQWRRLLSTSLKFSFKYHL